MPAEDSIAAGIGAGSNLLGGILAQAPDTEADDRLPVGTPQANFPLQASLFDAGGAIGFANPDLLSSAGPLNRLFAQIQALPITEKQKRRALLGLNQMAQGAAGPSRGVRSELKGTLNRLGLNLGDIATKIEEQQQFEQRLGTLKADFGPFQENVIRDRLAASAGVANTAAGFATGQGSLLQDQFRDQILRDQRRNFDDLETTARLRGQFSGANPGFEISRINDLRGRLPLDAELAAIERAFSVAGGVNALLTAGSATAQGAAGQAAQANQGALSTAAQQSTVANQLQANLLQNNALSLANGVAAAGQNLAEGVRAESPSNNLGTLLSLYGLGGGGGGTGGAAPAT